MQRDKIEDRIKNMIIRRFSLSNISNANDIDNQIILLRNDLGFNSLEIVELMVGLEDEFGIEISDEDFRIELFESVQAMAEYVKSALSSSKIGKKS